VGGRPCLFCVTDIAFFMFMCNTKAGREEESPSAPALTRTKGTAAQLLHCVAELSGVQWVYERMLIHAQPPGAGFSFPTYAHPLCDAGIGYSHSYMSHPMTKTKFPWPMG
jgi:hypothetical protein